MSSLKVVREGPKPILVIDSYKHQIASWLSKINSSITHENAFSALEMPKNTTHGDFAIPIPKLRLSGNPSQNATLLAEQVIS